MTADPRTMKCPPASGRASRLAASRRRARQAAVSAAAGAAAVVIALAWLGGAV